jgi:hypothetical protein
VVGVKGIRDPVVAVVVSTVCYFYFILYGLTLITSGACSLSWLRLSSRVPPCITDDVLLLGGSNVGDVAYNIRATLTGFATSFSPPPPLQPWAEGGRCHCCGDDGEVAPTYSWSRNLKLICCILDHFLRPKLA